jgi:hypothetical protein
VRTDALVKIDKYTQLANSERSSRDEEQKTHHTRQQRDASHAFATTSEFAAGIEPLLASATEMRG